MTAYKYFEWPMALVIAFLMFLCWLAGVVTCLGWLMKGGLQ